MKGNPYTDKIDPGFDSAVFAMTFNKSLKTDDGRYLIPDHTDSSLTISCSLSSKSASYTGTQNYQKELSSHT